MPDFNVQRLYLHRMTMKWYPRYLWRFYDPEDIVQDTLRKAIRVGFVGEETEQRVRTWLTVILRNIIIDVRRRASKRLSNPVGDIDEKIMGKKHSSLEELIFKCELESIPKEDMESLMTGTHRLQKFKAKRRLMTSLYAWGKL